MTPWTCCMRAPPRSCLRSLSCPAPPDATFPRGPAWWGWTARDDGGRAMTAQGGVVRSRRSDAAIDVEFAAWMAARQGALTRTAYLLTGSQHAADDLVQVTLAKLYL